MKKCRNSSTGFMYISSILFRRNSLRNFLRRRRKYRSSIAKSSHINMYRFANLRRSAPKKTFGQFRQTSLKSFSTKFFSRFLIKQFSRRHRRPHNYFTRIRSRRNNLNNKSIIWRRLKNSRRCVLPSSKKSTRSKSYRSTPDRGNICSRLKSIRRNINPSFIYRTSILTVRKGRRKNRCRYSGTSWLWRRLNDNRKTGSRRIRSRSN